MEFWAIQFPAILEDNDKQSYPDNEDSDGVGLCQKEVDFHNKKEASRSG